ncbi:uncharacterized protein LOC132066278 [Lycium ferocissimum]|uniref:uncharacterized protein LOC132066278 n=1 Tax=Lycium ferocissimum TaxID=112874 RepID=UPI0028168E74|nr:uncharacterized protein LOC132066278 [Lycium ferocissimum]
MSSEFSDEYASVDSESLHGNENSSSDEHANNLVESFCSQTLVEVDVTEFNNVIDKIHLSPRGRGRGRSNNRGGRQSTRGRGGRGTYQMPISISSNGAFERLQQIIRLQHPPFIAISEPFHKADQIEKYKRLLGYTNAYANCNSQIWLLWNDLIDCRVVEETDQQATCLINWMGNNVLITTVYAKCDANLREALWDSMRDISVNYNLPWLIAGDFNCITDPAEKQGGTPHRMSKSLPFLQCIMDCDLIDPGYSGSNFTWCNGWAPDKRVWQRLDRVLINQEWSNLFESTNVDHLIRTGSDHSPLLTMAIYNQRNHVKYFRFLDPWTEEQDFKETGSQAWNIEVQGSPMWRFHLKLKNTCKKLSEWSKNSVGNIFDQVINMEKKVAEMEDKMLNDNFESNRADLNHANALLIKAYKKEEAYWKQKAGIQWFVEGEINSKFFHSFVKGGKKRLSLKKMRKDDGSWIEGDEDITNEAISIFKNQFSKEDSVKDFSILNCIPKVINDDDNEQLTSNPTMDELKDVIRFLKQSLTPVSSSFPNWYPLTKQSFIRSTTDNIMLTQEIVHNINRTSPAGNVVLKLDMTKAYDRVSWEYLCKVLRQFGFAERWIDSVWRLITNVWYSVNINGTRHGFFNSSRGIKQGDPLSPSLFIIGAELFTIMMETLNQSKFIPFSMDKNGPNISHLCYADDTILFSSCDPHSLGLLMSRLGEYEGVSGQLINRNKSGFYVTFKEDDPRISLIKGITGFNHCQFPMIYLGCPIYVGRKKIVYFNTMVAKVARRL